jgi:hypothetical protein
MSNSLIMMGNATELVMDIAYRRSYVGAACGSGFFDAPKDSLILPFGESEAM